MIDEPLQTNAADPLQVTEGRRSAKATLRRHRGLVRWVLSTRDGREFMHDVVLPAFRADEKMGGSLEDVFAQAALHNVGVDLRRQLQEHPEFYLQMVSEGLKRDHEHATVRKSQRTGDDDGYDEVFTT